MVRIDSVETTTLNKSCNNFKHLGPRDSLIELSRCFSYSITLDAEWKPIPGFPNYSISSSGQILNSRSYGGKPRMLVPTLRFNTYFYVTLLSEDGKRVGVPVDRLVAIAFIDDNIEKYMRVQHKDNIRYNNRKENLQLKK